MSGGAVPPLFNFPIVDPKTGYPTPMFVQAWQTLVNEVMEKAVEVSQLSEASSSEGQRAFVSDSTVAASGNFGAAVAGGGSNVVPVYSDGTNWRIG
jgi:hypothetical protein